MIRIQLDATLEEQEAFAEAISGILGLLPHQYQILVDPA